MRQPGSVTCWARCGAVTGTFALALLLLAYGPACAGFYEDWFVAINAHDLDKIANMLAPDGTYEDVPDQAVFHGPAELRQHYIALYAAVPDLKCVAGKGIQDEKQGYLEWICSGTDVGIFKTQRHFEVRGIQADTFTAGKFQTHRGYWDVATAMRQLGVLPPAPAASAAASK